MTAVEWYIKKIKEARQMCDDASMGMDIWHTLDVLIGKGEQAKEMEKEQMIEFASYYTPLTKEELEIGFKHKFKNQEQ